VAWDAARVTEVVAAIRRYRELSEGDRAARLQADEYWWAIDAVLVDTLNGTIPIDAIDAMLHHPDADNDFRGYLAAGPIEDVLIDHPATYGSAVAALCREDPIWADTVKGIWLNAQEWAALPEELRQFIPINSISSDSTPAKKTRRKRPSKRQDSQPRHP